MQLGNAAHKIRDIIVRRMRNDFRRSPRLRDAPVFHHRDAVAHAQCFVQIVRDENCRLAHARRQLQKLVLQLAAYERVQSGKGFVHQQNVRVRRKRARQTDALLHAARQLRRATVAETFQRHLRDDSVRRLSSRARFFAAQLQSEGDVLAHGAVRQQRHILKNHSDFRAAQFAQFLRAHFRHRAPADKHFAVGRFNEAVDVAHHR